MIIRALCEEDLEQIAEIDMLLSLQLRWHNGFSQQEAFVAQENEKVLGAAALSKDNTWYYINSDRDDIEQYEMKLNICVRSGENETEIRRALTEKAREHFMLKKAEYPGKKLALRFWCWENDKAAMQVLLESGFGIPSVVVLLSYDLSGDLPAKKDIEGIAIGRHDCDEEGIKAYLKSNELGYDGVQDSEDELRFAMNDDSYRIFTACKEGDVLSACTVWRISDECWATENVFTVPDYRRMGLSRETIGEALRYLKAIGAKKTSLSVLGDNLNAIRLYLSLGFKLSLNILCFQLTVS